MKEEPIWKRAILDLSAILFLIGGIIGLVSIVMMIPISTVYPFRLTAGHQLHSDSHPRCRCYLRDRGPRVLQLRIEANDNESGNAWNSHRRNPSCRRTHEWLGSEDSDSNRQLDSDPDRWRDKLRLPREPIQTDAFNVYETSSIELISFRDRAFAGRPTHVRAKPIS